jgi:hypothetical protein
MYLHTLIMIFWSLNNVNSCFGLIDWPHMCIRIAKPINPDITTLWNGCINWNYNYRLLQAFLLWVSRPVDGCISSVVIVGCLLLCDSARVRLNVTCSQHNVDMCTLHLLYSNRATRYSCSGHELTGYKSHNRTRP